MPIDLFLMKNSRKVGEIKVLDSDFLDIIFVLPELCMVMYLCI